MKGNTVLALLAVLVLLLPGLILGLTAGRGFLFLCLLAMIVPLFFIGRGVSKAGSQPAAHGSSHTPSHTAKRRKKKKK